MHFAATLFGQSYKLEFVFEENEYFTNSLLSKDYEIDFSASTTRGKKLHYYGPTNVPSPGQLLVAYS